MFIIIMKQHGDLNCEQKVYGPYADYMDAEDALGDGTVPLLYGQGGLAMPKHYVGLDGHRYIQELEK